MPGIYSHYNRNVSSIWYLVVIFIVAVGLITWRTYLAIQDIQRNNEAMVASMMDEMAANQPR